MLVAVRHAAPAASEKGRCYGQSDIPLIQSHDESSCLVVENLPPEFSPEVIFSSDLERCQGLAEEVALRFPVATLRIDPILREIHFGDWERQLWNDIESSDPENFQKWMANWTVTRPPGKSAESAADILLRIKTWHQANLHLLENALIVGHAGPIRALFQILDPALDWKEAMLKPVSHLDPVILAD